MPKPAIRAFLTASGFSVWLSDAEPGAVLRYYHGFLARDVIDGAPGRSAGERRELLAVARLARCASEQGLVHLVQQRSEPGPFAYLAVKRGPAAAAVREVGSAAEPPQVPSFRPSVRRRGLSDAARGSAT